MGPRETCVYTAQGETEAQRVRGFLEAHGIPCEFRGEALRITHGLTLDGLGAVEVHVPLHSAREAREFIARAEAGELRIDDEPESEAP